MAKKLDIVDYFKLYEKKWWEEGNKEEITVETIKDVGQVDGRKVLTVGQDKVCFLTRVGFEEVDGDEVSCQVERDKDYIWSLTASSRNTRFTSSSDRNANANSYCSARCISLESPKKILWQLRSEVRKDHMSSFNRKEGSQLAYKPQLSGTILVFKHNFDPLKLVSFHPELKPLI